MGFGWGTPSGSLQTLPPKVMDLATPQRRVRKLAGCFVLCQVCCLHSSRRTVYYCCCCGCACRNASPIFLGAFPSKLYKASKTFQALRGLVAFPCPNRIAFGSYYIFSFPTYKFPVAYCGPLLNNNCPVRKCIFS